MKLNFDLRVIGILVIIGCAPITFISASTEFPPANGAAPAAPQASPTPTPCASPNPVSKFASNPAVVEVDTTNDFYAVGDPHADPARLAGVLLKAGIIGAMPTSP